LDQFAKATFALDTAEITGGAIEWEGSKEVGLTEVRLDGLLTVKEPERARGLEAPWCEASRHADVVVEIKMPGDHLNAMSVFRAELRRAAWHVKRAEREDPEWEGSVGLWMVAPHVPAVVRRMRSLHEVAPGCYALGDPASASWWIAANELPLSEALIPFLVARSGKALVELGRWLVGRKPASWLLYMLKSAAMNPADRYEIYRQIRFENPPPELREQWRWLVGEIVKLDPEAGREVYAEGALREVRKNLRLVLTVRGIPVNPDQEARIEACQDLATIERWHRQALTAASADEALA
jgi:hypothetical protein